VGNEKVKEEMRRLLTFEVENKIHKKQKYTANYLYKLLKEKNIFNGDRYEKKSLLITTNLAFTEWDKVFKDQMVANATIDRLIHYSVVFKF
jgi:hypothetical protein